MNSPPNVTLSWSKFNGCKIHQVAPAWFFFLHGNIWGLENVFLNPSGAVFSNHLRSSSNFPPEKSTLCQKSCRGFPFNRSVSHYFFGPRIYQRTNHLQLEIFRIKYPQKNRWFFQLESSQAFKFHSFLGGTNTFWKETSSFQSCSILPHVDDLVLLQAILPEPFHVNRFRLPEGPLFRLEVWRRIHNTQRSLIKQRQWLKSHPTTMFNGF